ncbi:MAG: ATP-dependent Clp protease ATP-binding subunit, partial [Christensenellaceae bacterium]|nr:ATP-dependent Clp protease ATP-binding subunit [Christensenellaceae bacterium]
VIIMTSNVGAHNIEKQKKIGFAVEKDADKAAKKSYEDMRENILAELKRSFRPEFINRIDDIIVFHKLDESGTLEIAKLMLASIAGRLAERDIHLTYTEEAAAYLAEQGFDEEYGARPLRRMVQQTVEDRLSEEILEGNIHFGDHVEMYMAEGKPAFRKAEAPAKEKAETPAPEKAE